MESRTDPVQTDFKAPRSVHCLCIPTESESEEDNESASNLDPAIESYCSIGRYQDDIPPLGTMNRIPAIWVERSDEVAVENVDLYRKNHANENERHNEKAYKSGFVKSRARRCKYGREVLAIFSEPNEDKPL